jgi:dTDP-4-dehydrorhamnose reductase
VHLGNLDWHCELSWVSREIDFVSVDSQELDITDQSKVSVLINSIKPSVIATQLHGQMLMVQRQMNLVRTP